MIKLVVTAVAIAAVAVLLWLGGMYPHRVMERLPSVNIEMHTAVFISIGLFFTALGCVAFLIFG